MIDIILAAIPGIVIVVALLYKKFENSFYYDNKFLLKAIKNKDKNLKQIIERKNTLFFKNKIDFEKLPIIDILTTLGEDNELFPIIWEKIDKKIEYITLRKSLTQRFYEPRVSIYSPNNYKLVLDSFSNEELLNYLFDKDTFQTKYDINLDNYLTLLSNNIKDIFEDLASIDYDIIKFLADNKVKDILFKTIFKIGNIYVQSKILNKLKEFINEIGHYENNNNILLEAIDKSLYELAIEIIRETEIDINYKNEKNETVISLLINLYMTVNNMIRGTSYLHINKNIVDLIEVTLKAGARLEDIPDKEELIYKAVVNNNYFITHLLLKVVDVNIETKEGPLLNIAVRNNNKEMIKLLLDAGADITRKDLYGRTAKELALILNTDRRLF